MDSEVFEKKIRAELDRIKVQISQIEDSIAKFGARTSSPPSAAPEPLRVEPPSIQNHPFVPTSPVTESSEQTTGNFLGFVGVICLIISAIFIIKLTIDSGWLTPIRQLGLAGILAGAMISCGLLLFQNDEIYFSLLPGAGIVILYICAIGGHAYYHLYGSTMSFFFVGSTSALCLTLFSKFRQYFYVIIAIIGSYLAPFVVGGETPKLYDLMFYHLCWNLTFCVFAVSLKDRVVVLISSFLALATFFVLGSFYFHDSLSTLAVFQLIQFLMFGVAIMAHTMIHRDALRVGQAWAFFPLLAMFYVTEYFWVESLSPNLAPWLALGFGCVINLLYFLTKSAVERDDLNSSPVIHLMNTVILMHTLYFVWLADKSWTPWISLSLFGVFFILKDQLKLMGRHAAYLWAGIVLGVIGYFQILIAEPSHFGGEAILVGVCYGSILFCWSLWGRRSEGNIGSNDDSAVFSLVAGQGQILLALYRLSQIWFGEYSQFGVTVLWLALATGILCLSFSMKDRRLASSALIVFAIAAGKGLLYDVSGAEPIIRILCFLSLGLGFYFGGFLFRRIAKWGS